MKTDDYNSIPLSCYYNGDYEILTIAEILKIMPKINFLWLCLEDQYFWIFPEYKGCSDVCRKAGKVGMRLAFYIHTNNGSPFTMIQAQKYLNNNSDNFERNTFIAWASRFQRIFKDSKNELLPKPYRPFYFLEVPYEDSRNICCPAYKLDKYNTLVIQGTDPDSDFSDETIPWHILKPEI